MFEKFELPISKYTMPWPVKDLLRDHYIGDLIEISRHGFGTPDGECDTDSWNFTFINRETGVVTFVNHIYKGHNVLAAPAVKTTSCWASWLDHGIKYVTKYHDDGTYTLESEEVVIDCDKIRRMIYKMKAKKTIELEVA
jgi:hypothetical protein